MNYFLLIISLMTVNYTIAQSTILEGRIIDETSQDPVLYVNVGIIGGNTGTVSNLEGIFSLSVPDSLIENKLRISVYGYESMILNISSLIERTEVNTPLSISLKRHSQEVAEIQVNGRELKKKVIGRRAESGIMTIGFSSDELGTEMGVFLKVKKKSHIEDFNFYLNNSDYDSLTFRINFYACDKKNNPTDSLLAESIIFKLDSMSTGSVKIDLKEYYLILRENTYLSLEVVDGFYSENALEKGVKSEKHPGLTFGAEFGGNASFRFTSQSTWETIPLVAPGLYLNVLQ